MLRLVGGLRLGSLVLLLVPWLLVVGIGLRWYWTRGCGEVDEPPGPTEHDE